MELPDGKRLAWHVRTARYVVKVVRESSIEVVGDMVFHICALLALAIVSRVVDYYLRIRFGKP